jgi:methylthioribose-1-phosphate isomerase
LAARLLGVPSGTQPYRYDSALAFRRMPRLLGAFTLGGVILPAGDSLDAMVPTRTARLRRPAKAARVCLGAPNAPTCCATWCWGHCSCPSISFRRRFRPQCRSNAPRIFSQLTGRVGGRGHDGVAAIIERFDGACRRSMQSSVTASSALGTSGHDTLRAVQWLGDRLHLLDQRKLPFEEAWIDCRGAGEVAQAIRDLVVRGAPAIGIAAAWGVVLAAQRSDDLDATLATLRAARPTAVNLMWALDRMRGCVDAGADAAALAREAQAIQDEDLAANRAMGAMGAALIAPHSGVLTHCNTGSLATAGFGTALGVIRAGVASGNITRVYADETRPWLQGARLTMWELQQDGIPATLIADSAASHLMKSGKVQWVVVGADRIAANGDTANKIGTYQLAIAARHHGVRFMVVAPSTTIDMATPSGDDIHIELRDPLELLSHAGQRTVTENAQAWNPVFDVTPHELIDVLVTERGVITQPDATALRAVFGKRDTH